MRVYSPVFFRLFLGLCFLFFSIHCTNTRVDTFGSDDVVAEKTIREELLAIAFAKCIQTNADSQKLLEAFIFVDKLFSKSSGSRSERDSITYRKKDADNCRNNLLLYETSSCDFKPFDFSNYILDKALCNPEPVSFFQF